MKLYIVTKEGVYRHGIFGVYSTFERAIKNAWVMIEKEEDDYHDFHVSLCSLDCPDEDELIAWVSRMEKIITEHTTEELTL